MTIFRDDVGAIAIDANREGIPEHGRARDADASVTPQSPNPNCMPRHASTYDVEAKPTSRQPPPVARRGGGAVGGVGERVPDMQEISRRRVT
jgi:hypothetical protein